MKQLQTEPLVTIIITNPNGGHFQGIMPRAEAESLAERQESRGGVTVEVRDIIQEDMDNFDAQIRSAEGLTSDL